MAIARACDSQLAHNKQVRTARATEHRGSHNSRERGDGTNRSPLFFIVHPQRVLVIALSYQAASFLDDMLTGS